MAVDLVMNIAFILIAVVACMISHKTGYYEGYIEGTKTEHRIIKQVMKDTVKGVTGEDIDV